MQPRFSSPVPRWIVCRASANLENQYRPQNCSASNNYCAWSVKLKQSMLLHWLNNSPSGFQLVSPLRKVACIRDRLTSDHLRGYPESSLKTKLPGRAEFCLNLPTMVAWEGGKPSTRLVPLPPPYPPARRARYPAIPVSYTRLTIPANAPCPQPFPNSHCREHTRALRRSQRCHVVFCLLI